MPVLGFDSGGEAGEAAGAPDFARLEALFAAALERLRPYLDDADFADVRDRGLASNIEIGRDPATLVGELEVAAAGTPAGCRSPAQAVDLMMAWQCMPGGYDRWERVSLGLPDTWCDPLEWRLSRV